jgi:hypothetical protein
MTAQLKPEPRKVSDAEYAKMTKLERFAYAESFTPEARQIKPIWGMRPEERWALQQAETDAYIEQAHAQYAQNNR